MDALFNKGWKRYYSHNHKPHRNREFCCGRNYNDFFSWLFLAVSSCWCHLSSLPETEEVTQSNWILWREAKEISVHKRTVRPLNYSITRNNKGVKEPIKWLIEVSSHVQLSLDIRRLDGVMIADRYCHKYIRSDSDRYTRRGKYSFTV